MDHKQNYIAGEWLAGVSEVENRNPSDTSDLIGMFAQADAVQLDRALTQQVRPRNSGQMLVLSAATTFSMPLARS